MVRRRFRSDIFVYLFLILQACFWYYTKDSKPELQVVPEVPGQATVKALSFGDEEFYFRVLALELQNMGDTYGRGTALKHYNYKKLSGWFYLLDSLDNVSSFVPALASYYFSQTQNKPDVRYVVDYLWDHSSPNPSRDWWWLMQAVYLTNHVLDDKQRALKISYKLAEARGKDIPLWVRQWPAFMHEQLGEKEEALLIIKNILETEQTISPSERKFMNYFINERLGKMIDESGKNPH